MFTFTDIISFKINHTFNCNNCYAAYLSDMGGNYYNPLDCQIRIKLEKQLNQMEF